MSQPWKIHLFNCDRTYKLDAVEDLLNATKAKSRFVHMEKHYFSLAEMPDMSTKIIPKLDMNLAFFVVHAHESRLSINEDNAGIGYAKIYRALLRATGENVIIVIGGDDNYTNEDEEDQFVISRWAKRKISSQFSEEFLDGRKGFIFSFNKQHRPVHEEALTHFFDSSKKEQRFVYHLNKRRLPEKPVTPPLVRSTKPVQPLKLYRSLPEDQNTYWREGSFASLSSHNQARKDIVPSDSARGEGRSYRDIYQPDIWNTKPKDLVILDCGESDESTKAVKRVFDVLRPVLDISTDTAVVKCSPASAKSYLLKDTLRFCVLVVDGNTVKDVYERSVQERAQFEDLLRTAADEVVEKVVVVICDQLSVLCLRDEAFISEAVGRLLEGTGKGFAVWVKDNLMSMETDALAEMITASASAVVSIKPQPSYRGDFPGPSCAFQSPVSFGTERHEQLRKDNHARLPDQYGTHHGSDGRWNERNVGQQKGLSTIRATPSHTTKKYTGEPVKAKTRLYYGDISYDPGDVEILEPGFKVPSHIVRSLSQRYSHIPEAVVRIVSDPKSGELRWSVEPKSKGFLRKKKQESHSPTSTESGEPVPKAYNETFVLIARVRYGEVSMEKGDLEFIYPDWETPEYLAETLRREYWSTPDGKLFVISDEKGNLRFKVKIGKIDKALNLFNKTCGRNLTI